MNYEERRKYQADLESDISQISRLTRQFQSQLKKQENVRKGLDDYLDKGKQGLFKINSSLMEMGQRYSIFGCNTFILLAVVLVTIFILALL